MEKKEYILSGPPYTGEKFLGSIAEYIIPKMKLHPNNGVIQVDCKNEESITSQEFLKSSIEIAEGLINFGLKTGDVVVLATPNSIRCHETAMGIIFSGGVLAPIDQNQKPLEIQHLLREFQPKYVICETEKAKEIQKSLNSTDINAKIILLDVSKGNGEFYGWEDIRTNVDVANYIPRKVPNPKHDLALICCSSGSTGMPKGVALSHYCILQNNFTIESMDLYGWNRTILMNSPLFWISGVVLLLMSCTYGHARYIPKSCKPEHILEAIEKHKPFSIFMSPANLLFLVEHPDFKKYNLKDLKVVMTGGSVLGEAVAQKIKSTWKGITFYQGYGMTEVAGPITAPPNYDCIKTVGKLVAGFEAKVVDVTTGESLGPNKVGELRIKTERIMNGYYNNEKATKAAFDENGWLCTGDLVYYNEEELLFVAGRIKEIIKYRNYQISPTEIESFLTGIPGIRDAAVVPIPHEQDTYHLKAIVVKAPKSNITEEDIIESVKENLSDCKQLRQGVQFVEEIPRTETGKLRRSEAYKVAAV